MRRIVIAAAMSLGIVSLSTIVSADTLILRDGSRIEGTVLSIAGRTITFRHADGASHRYPTSRVYSLEFFSADRDNPHATKARGLEPPAGTELVVRTVQTIDSKHAGENQSFGAIATIAHAQIPKNLEDEIGQSDKAARVFRQIMDTPDKGIPKDLLEKAECVAVFPSVIKAGFIIGGRGGRGVASCRTARGWSAPAFFNLGGASIGLQIGAQSTDFVMLFMNKEGMNSLLSDEFTLGGDASVAAGPVGRQAGAATDLKLDAQILSYSRSKGLFAGLELKGVVIKPDKDDMRDAYGEGVTAKEVLKDNTATAPVAMRAFPNALGRYSSRNATE